MGVFRVGAILKQENSKETVSNGRRYGRCYRKLVLLAKKDIKRPSVGWQTHNAIRVQLQKFMRYETDQKRSKY